MMISRNPVAGAASKLDEAVATVQREAESAEADPFDDTMIAAAGGLAEALKAEADALEAVRGRMVRLARQVPR